MKHIFSYACVLAAVVSLASCKKYAVTETVDPNAKIQTVEVTATLPNVSGEGMLSSFTAKDFLRVRYVKSDGTQVGQTYRLTSGGAEGKTVTFKSDKVAVPNDAANMVVFVDNNETSTVNYGSYPTAANFNSQNGTLAGAVGKQVIMGTTAVSSKASVDLAYKTAIVKVTATYPEAPVAGQTTFTIGSEKQYSKVVLVGDKPAEGSTKGVITVPAATVDAAAKTATAYIAVWPVGGEYDGTYLVSKIGTTSYGNPLSVTAIKAGTTTTVKQEVKISEYNMWLNDEAGTINNVTGNVVSTPAWLTKSGSTINVAANTTGKIRKGTMVLDNGCSYVITQIGPAEFKGSYTFTAKFFSNNKSIVSAGNMMSIPVTFGEPVLGETLSDLDGSKYTNNIGIKGLYDTAIMDATVTIDYDKRTVKFGVLLDARDNAQKVSKSNVAGYEYVCFLPEMGTGTGTWTSPWNFIQPDLGTDQDYMWLWFDLSEDYSEITWNSYTKPQYNLSNLKTSANRVIGITCAVSKSNKVDAANVYKTYNVIYQANVNNSTTVPVTFKKN